MNLNCQPSKTCNKQNNKVYVYACKIIFKILVYCTVSKFHYLFNFNIFTDPEDVLKLICMKYYELDINQL